MDKTHIKNLTQQAFDKLKAQDPSYYAQLTNHYQLTPQIVADYAANFFNKVIKTTSLKTWKVF